MDGPITLTNNRYHHTGTAAGFRDRRVGSEFIAGFANWPAHIGETGSTEGDPQLSSSFHLLPTSPLINAGSSLINVTHDYDGSLRVGPVDIGADETGGPALLVPPPAETVGIGTISGPSVGFVLATSSGSESIINPQIIVSLSSAHSQSVSVNYRLSSGTASASDYVVRTGTLVFAPGQRTAIVPLTVVNDAIDENNETVKVTLGSPVGASLGISQHTYTIVDDDASPAVQFATASTSLLERSSPRLIVVTLSAASTRSISVDYQLQSGSAISGRDFRAGQGRIVFLPGQTQRTISVTPIDDGLDEPAETFSIVLRSPINADLGTIANHTITLVDDDTPPTASLALASASVREDAGAATVEFRLNRPSGNPVVLNYAITSQTATSGVDFTGGSGTVTFAPGEISKSIVIPIVNDGLIEANESLQVGLTLVTNAYMSQARTHTLTILDDDNAANSPASMVYRLPNGYVYRIAPTAGAEPVDLSLQLNQMSPGSEDDAINISPDGKWLALITDRFGIGAGWTGLAVVTSDLTRGGAVIVDGQFVHPEGAIAIASGGNVVVYSASGGPHVRDLWAATKQTNGEWSLRLLTSASPFAFNAQPALSSDGTKVLFDAGNQPYGTGSEAICEVNIDGTGFHQVVTHQMRPVGGVASGGIHHADYAPDGSIVFEAAWTGDQIWRLPVGSSQPVRISGANNEVSPCVLADGRVVSLWLNRPGNPNGYHELTVRSPDGTYQLTLLPGVDVEDIGLSCGGL